MCCLVFGIFSKALLILPTICILGKATNSNNVLLSTYGKISSLHSCHTATFINLELNAEIPLIVLIILFSQYVCHFPESEILLLDQWQLMVAPPPTNHQLNNRLGLDRMKAGSSRLRNQPEIRKGNRAAVSHPLSVKPPVCSVSWYLAFLH